MSDSTANSTDRLLRDCRSVPQVLCEEAKDGRDEPSEPSVLWKTALSRGQNVSMPNEANSRVTKSLICGVFITFFSPKHLDFKAGLYSNHNQIPELFAKHEKISRILFGVFRHFFSSVPQLLEAVVNISNKLSAG